MRSCVLEGEHLCNELLRHLQTTNTSNHAASSVLEQNIQVQSIVIPSEGVSTQTQELARHLSDAAPSATLYTTSPQKFDLLCDAAQPQRILTVIDFPAYTSVRKTPERSPILVLDGVSDPGNVGTIIRTADWFGVRTILLGEGCADRFHPKTLRATMGSFLRCAVQSVPSLVEHLQDDFAEYELWGASLQASLSLKELSKKLHGKSGQTKEQIGIVLGSESRGISPEVERCLHGMFKIGGGLQGTESLNVAIAAGVILYELFGSEK